VPLTGKDLDGKVLLEVEGANFLDDCDLRRADLSRQNLEGAYVADSDLTEADLSGADLYWAKAFGAKFDRAIMRNTQLNGANLVEARFKGADLRGAYISYDNLGGGANLVGADLTGALLDGTDLKGSEYTDSTRFPDGFDPAAHGMIWMDPNRFYVRPGSFESAKILPGWHVPEKNK
jgi:uncharacterized protein YjbI with pentapeptide repeats